MKNKLWKQWMISGVLVSAMVVSCGVSVSVQAEESNSLIIILFVIRTYKRNCGNSVKVIIAVFLFYIIYSRDRFCTIG